MSKILQVWKADNYGKGVLNGSQDFFRITPDLSPNGGGAEWGGITGTLSAQTDLQTALDGKVAKADYTPSHSVLAQQSGTGSPTAVQIGTNEILGRLSGGGSDIKGLTTSETRTLLSINNVDNTSDLNKPISTATQTALDTKTLPLIADDTTAVVTGVSVPTAFRSYLIPAGTLTNYNRLIMQMQVRKESGTGNGTVQLWVNDSNNFATATNIGSVTAGSSIQFVALERKMIMRGTDILHINGTVNIVSDTISSAQPWVSTAFNRANDIWVFVACNPASVTEVYTLEYFEMNARRTKTTI
jgi:hypothetical protein